MLRHIRSFRAGSWSKALIAAAGVIAAATRFASADAGADLALGQADVVADAPALSLDDAWFISVARAESLLAGARVRSDIDSADRAAVAEQIQFGVHVLASLVHASISADTLLDRPIAAARPSRPPNRWWGSRVLKVAGVVAAAASLLHPAASLGNAGPQLRNALAYVGGSAAAIASLFSRLRSPPSPDPIERIRMVGLETDLRDAIQETERAAESLWRELRGMALDSCTTDDQIVTLARRYANALPAASMTLDARVARSASIARTCSEFPGYGGDARERFGTLASHLDATSVLWRERQALFERSRRNALDCLVILDRP